MKNNKIKNIGSSSPLSKGEKVNCEAREATLGCYRGFGFKASIGKFSAFSIIEIIIGVFIFTLGIASVYAIILSTLRINDYNENHIIASNLANEQIELVRNIRDSNYKKIKKYNQINPGDNNYNNVFEIGKKYKIENNYSITSNFPIEVMDITEGFEEGVDKLNGSSMQGYNLCLDSSNRYIYCSSDSTKTKFYRYISIEEIKYMDSGAEKVIDDAFIVRSKVIWYMRGYHEFEVKSIIADWKRL